MTSHAPPKFRAPAKRLLSPLYLLWAGMIIGVAFIATPVKFQAPHLTMSVALEVGKATFHLFNLIEWGTVAGAILLTVLARPARRVWVMALLLALLLAVQTFWLLPALDIRADAVIAGGTPAPGHLHWLYIIAECAKLIFTLVAAWLCAKEVRCEA